MKIVVTGVSGYIGSHIADAFLTRGNEVVGLSRRQPRDSQLSSWCQAELGHGIDEQATAGADLFVHCAMDTSRNSYTRNVEGTKLWARQAIETGARRQLFISSFQAHPEAPSEYGRAKWALEGYFAGLDALILRPGIVVGPGGIYLRIVSQLRRLPVVPVVGGNCVRKSLTDIRILVAVIVRHEQLENNRVYNLFSKEAYGMLDLLCEIRRHHRLRCLLLPVSIRFAKAGIGMLEMVGLRPYFSTERLRALEKSQEYDYVSSYDELGIPDEPLYEILGACKR